MSLLRSPWANSLSLAGIPAARLTQGNSRGSRTVTQVWFGIAVATVLADSPFETTRESFPDSRFPPRFGNRTRGVIAILVRGGK